MDWWKGKGLPGKHGRSQKWGWMEGPSDPYTKPVCKALSTNVPKVSQVTLHDLTEEFVHIRSIPKDMKLFLRFVFSSFVWCIQLLDHGIPRQQTG